MRKKIYLLSLMLFVFFIQNVSSQSQECEVLDCSPDIHVSVDENCEVHIYPARFIKGGCTLTNYQLTLTDQSGDTVQNPVTIDYINTTIVAELIALDLDDTCTTNIVIDDKIAPVINGITGPLTLTCLDDFEQQYTIDVTENCDYNIVSEISISGDGDPFYTVDITWTVIDIGGNQASQIFTAYLEGFWDIIQWPPDYFAFCEEDLIDPAGPIITIPPDCPRAVDVGYVDWISDCQIIREWTVTDVGTGLQTSNTQTLSYFNPNPPVIVADDEVHITLKEFNAGWELEYDVLYDCIEDPLVYVSRDIFPISCSPEYFKIIYTITATVDCGPDAIHLTVVHVKAKQKPKIWITGKKSCYEPFIIRTLVQNMAPPFQYDYTLNNFYWSIVDLGAGRARVYPGKGKVVINVNVTDQAGCLSQNKIKFSCNKFIPTPFSANMEETKLYPNPSTGELFISGEGIQEVLVYNIEGKLVKSYLNLFRNEIDVSDLGNGIYIVKIKTLEEEVVRRLVKI
jgi:hypothetical protein